MKLIRLNAKPSESDIKTIYNASNNTYVSLIVNALFDVGIVESNQISYALATVKHETDNFSSLYERYNGDPKTFFNNLYGNRTDLGNREGTDDGYTYRGRGFVHLTGRVNYEKMGKIFGIDLLNNPDLAAQPEWAAKILAYGMLHGSYTGKDLDDYINENQADYFNARSIIDLLQKSDYKIFSS